MDITSIPPVEIEEFALALMGQCKSTVTSEPLNVYDYEMCLTILQKTKDLSRLSAERVMQEEYLEHYFEATSPIFFVREN